MLNENRRSQYAPVFWLQKDGNQAYIIIPCVFLSNIIGPLSAVSTFLRHCQAGVYGLCSYHFLYSTTRDWPGSAEIVWSTGFPFAKLPEKESIRPV